MLLEPHPFRFPGRMPTGLNMHLLNYNDDMASKFDT